MMKRNLYLTTIPVEEAKKIYLTALGDDIKPRSEVISVTDALGRVTAEAVYAKFSSPLYNSAAMDGIAVISSRTNWASESSPVLLMPKEDYVIVDTGDPIRKPYDAVIMAEDIQETPDGVLIRSSAPAWQHVRPIGEDIISGEMILTGYHRIRPIDIGVLLSGGVTKIPVFAQPRVGIIPTGTEIIEPYDDPKEGEIIESNSRMFEAMVRENGGIPVRYDIVKDDKDEIRESVLKALSENDIVIVNAGSSAGTEDYTVHILREIGEVFVHGVAMKPGKPVILGRACGKPIIGIPGYPVSAYLAMENFVYPLLASFTGLKGSEGRTIEAVLSRRLVSSLKHREYVRVRVGRVGGRYVCSPLARGAGAAMSMVRADGFCIIPQEKEGYEAGETVTVNLFGSTEELDKTLVCIGSHDLLLDIISDLMSGEPGGVRLSSTHVGSLGGLMALRRGEAHLTPSHLLDEKTGVYNESYIRTLFPGEKMVLVKAVRRIQGFIVAKGNPLGITGIEDLTRVQYVNRQRGAGTRVLLDYMLSSAGIPTETVRGYDAEAATHMAVAAQVAGGEADCGMGVYSAAHAMGLDFIPVGEEEYDFVMRKDSLEMPEVKCFLKLLGS
ncbi:MAG: molybdopterin biosynthesis protein, partial [Oscillospiraceae bacterium]|nr:molybdopterin biosynthesis protein [Oscillospiraceae bacterium]